MGALLTWYGGYVGVTETGRELHLLRGDNVTFCGRATGMRPIARPETANHRLTWCEDCNRLAQESRRDVPGAVA